MKRTLVVIMLLAAFSVGLTIEEPLSDVTSETIPIDVVSSWTGSSANYQVTLTKDAETIYDELITETTETFSLEEGDYLLTINGTNESNSTTFSVTLEEPDPPILTISAQKNNYNVGENVRFTATTDRPLTAQLEVSRESNVEETYTISMTGSLNLIYIPEQTGNWQATLTAEGATATTSFTVEGAQPLTPDFTFSTPTVSTPTTFTAAVTGGTLPYTYQWLFSDDTTSHGEESTHYFFEYGDHSTTLIVTDSDNAQESITKTFTVEAETYELEITVINQNEHTVEDMTLTLWPEEGDEIDLVTGRTGTVEFEGLRGRYQLILTQLDEQYYNNSINISEDENMLIHIEYGEDAPEVNNTNTTNTTEEEPEEIEEETEVETVSVAAPAPLTAERQAEEDLEEKRRESISKVNEVKFDLRLSSQKDGALTELDLYNLFDDAVADIKRAKNEQEIERAVNKAPIDLTILDETTEVSYPDEEDVEEHIETFIEAKRIEDDDLADSYRYSAKKMVESVSIKTKQQKVKINYPDKTQTFTLVHREVTAPDQSYVVEIIPKSFAKDVSEMKIEGGHEVLESDPVIRMNDLEYSYSTAKNAKELGYALVLPEELEDPGLLTGFLSFDLSTGNPTRNIWYVVIIGLFIAGIYVGRRITSKGTSSTFSSFAELANIALDKINDGDGASAAEVTPEILAIYEELPPDQQTTLREVMHHLKINLAEQQFMLDINTLYQTVGDTPDINTLSSAYERIISSYESLPELLQEKLEPHIKELDQYLDQVVPTDT